MPRSARRILSSLLVLCLASPAMAWGPQGHRVITRVALTRLTPRAAEAVREMLNSGDTLVDVSDWADHDGHFAVPGSASWHYVNVPLAATKYEDKDSPKAGSVVTKIAHFRKVLADKAAPERERRRALLFLVHFIEDIHQPLHVGDNGDHGGNDTQIQFVGAGTNLHRLWDSDLLHHEGGNDKVWVDRVTPLLTPEHVKAWSSRKVEVWADESLAAAKTAYEWPVGSKSPLKTGAELNDAYARHVDPILREQLAKAGVRLANELNAIFE